MNHIIEEEVKENSVSLDSDETISFLSFESRSNQVEEEKSGRLPVDLSCINEDNKAASIDDSQFGAYCEDVENGVYLDSEDSVESDIPEEHENGYGFNEYTRRYNLNI